MTIRYILLAAIVATASPSWGQLIVAHRGASHDAPENTIPAFELAWEQGADGIEGDFYLSSDGKVICFHDKDTKRVAGVNHVVADTSYKTLRSLDVGSWKDPKYAGTRIPLCEEVLETVPDGKKIYIELKAGPEIVGPLAKVIDQSSLKTDQIIIICFDQKTLAACAEQLPNIRTHWLSSYKKKKGQLHPLAAEVVTSLKQAKAEGFGSNAMPDHFDSEFLSKLNSAGFNEFHVWTINDPQVANFYRKLGAYSITTDRPGWLREQMASSSDP